MNDDSNSNHYYKKIFKLGQIVTSEVDLDKLFHVIIDQINQIMQTEICSVFLHDSEADELYSQVSTDVKKNEIRIPINHGICGWVFQNRKTQIVNDPYSDPRFLQKIDKTTGFKTRNILSIPLINRNDICIGTLQILNKQQGQFSDNDKTLLITASHYVVIALENAKLYKELKTLDKARKRVVDHLSHELKTPLSIISGSFAIIKDRTNTAGHAKGLDKTFIRGFRNINRLMDLQEKTSDILTKDAEAVAQDRQHLSNLMESLIFLLDDVQNQDDKFSDLAHLLIEKVESFIPQETIDKENIPAKEFLETICNNSRQEMGTRNISINCETDNSLSLFMDKSVLTKVCKGLLKNAIENTPDQGTIVIRTASKNNNIKIDFIDYGVGITKENQELIFGGFFHTQETSLYSSKAPYEFNAGGSGADLLRIKMLSERHGFDIGFKSTRCRFLPNDMDTCPGSIEKCKHISSFEDCQAAEGSAFNLLFYT